VSTVRERVVYLAYAGCWRAVRLLPERSAYGIFRVLADLAWRRRGTGVLRLEANLRRVVGPQVGEEQLRALSREGLRSYLRYWCDTFRLADWPPDRILGRVEVVGGEHYRTALAAGRGLVLALPHMGNWDHAGAWSAAQGNGITSVAERLRPERLFERFVAYRARLGIEIVPLSADVGETMNALVRATRENRVVCLLADRDLTGGGIPVTFFGETARMPAGPALVALRTRAPLHATTVSYTPTGIRLRFHDPVEPPASGTTRERVAAMTQQIAAAFEEAVAAAPQDWHMLQPVWVRDRPDDRVAA
jgi:KDO2-lipid IV(A) lauroyltransferase